MTFRRRRDRRTTPTAGFRAFDQAGFREFRRSKALVGSLFHQTGSAHYRFGTKLAQQPEGRKRNSTMNTTQLSEENTMTQPAKLLYTAKAHTTGGREGGASCTSDGRLDVKLSVPGAPGNGTNPEQLFAVGWAACFTSAIKFVASQMKVKLPPDMATDSEVDLLSGNDGYFLQARLNVSLPGVERQVAQSILDRAHQTCPYSKATRGNIHVEVNLV